MINERNSDVLRGHSQPALGSESLRKEEPGLIKRSASCGAKRQICSAQNNPPDIIDEDAMDYLSAAVDIKKTIIELIKYLRGLVHKQNLEIVYLRERLSNEKPRNAEIPEKPEILSGKSIADAFAKLWEENRNLRFSLLKQKFRSPQTFELEMRPPYDKQANCLAVLKHALTILNQAALYDTMHWQKRCFESEKERERLSIMVMKLTDRLTSTENLIRRDPFLCEAFQLQLTRFSAGDIVSQLHDTFAQLALSQLLNKELEQQLNVEKSISRGLSTQWATLQEKITNMFEILIQHPCRHTSHADLSTNAFLYQQGLTKPNIFPVINDFCEFPLDH